MRFEYLRPKSVQEAISLLREHDGKARVIAGGTDLVVDMRAGMTNQTPKLGPQYVIDLESIPELDYIECDEKQGLRLGALDKIRALEKSSLLHQYYPVISQAAGQLGSVAIRNVATIGGNLCNAVPSAEMPPALIALSAKARIAGFGGDRVIPLEEFFVSSCKTVLNPAELLVEILVPVLPPNTKGVYLKHGKRWGTFDLAIVNVAVVLTLEADNQTCRDVKIVLGAVASTPMRAKKAEAILSGKKIESSLIEKAAQAASEEARPITDIRASAAYRAGMVKVFTRRALEQIMAK